MICTGPANPESVLLKGTSLARAITCLGAVADAKAVIHGAALTQMRLCNSTPPSIHLAICTSSCQAPRMLSAARWKPPDGPDPGRRACRAGRNGVWGRVLRGPDGLQPGGWLDGAGGRRVAAGPVRKDLTLVRVLLFVSRCPCPRRPGCVSAALDFTVEWICHSLVC